MRIIAGSARGRKLDTLPGIQTRPTADRVKEAMFSILAPFLLEAQVLDAFAGSGALGLEALSRGAKSALFFEKHLQAAKICEKNITACAFDQAKLYKGDIFEILPRLRKKDPYLCFDIIFLDPSYQSDLLETAIKRIIKDEWLAENGQIIAESAINSLVIKAQNLQLIKERIYGETVIRFYTMIKKDSQSIELCSI